MTPLHRDGRDLCPKLQSPHLHINEIQPQLGIGKGLRLRTIEGMGGKWYFSGINRSEEKYFRFCCVHGKVKVVRNQVYRRSKVVLGVLRVLSTLVVGFSVKKGPILLLKLRKVIVFFCELRKTLFSVLTRKKRTFLLHQEMGPFLLNTQQHRWTTLAHQELPCSCDKLDF